MVEGTRRSLLAIVIARPNGICTHVQVRSPRACAVSYPTREAEGLLWVWGRGGPGAQGEAEAAEWKGIAGLVDQRGDAAYTSSHRWYFR